MAPVARASIEEWIEGYERAWRAAGTGSLRELFVEEATYRMSPYEEAARGIAAIAELWEREREGPDEPFEMRHAIVAAEGDTAVIRVSVQYGGPDRLQYRDLWVVRFAVDGRCLEFEEWPFWPERGVGPG